nr:L-threonylcarbamoyladenylate synthase [Caldisalinibacter kiritimatiensis]
MKTKVLKIDINNLEKQKIEQGAEILKRGGTVAFPTETVYGLGANALDEKAISKIFKAKGRPQDNPLIVHIAEIEQLYDIVEEVPQRALDLIERFWPGPLTIIFKKNSKVPDRITGGLSTVAIRMPNHPIALKLIKEANLPIAAPSANTSGRPSPTDASHVIEDLTGKIDMIIDGGATGIGVESTVLDLSTEIPTILRPGGVTKEDLLTIFPKVEFDPALELKNKNIIPKSPGQKYRHYSPEAEMIIVTGEIHNMIEKINELTSEYQKEGKKVGIIATNQTKDKYNNENLIVVGDRRKLETISRNLFKTLREFDKIGVDIIIAEGVTEEGLGKAIMNRMNKAAGGRVIKIN